MTITKESTYTKLFVQFHEMLDRSLRSNMPYTLVYGKDAVGEYIIIHPNDSKFDSKLYRVENLTGLESYINILTYMNNTKSAMEDNSDASEV